MLQGSVRRRNAKQELSQRRQVRDDGAATMLQGSVRRRNAKQELSQRRQVRDDGAATMLQGSVRRRNARQEVQQRRQVRDDGMATLLQGAERRRRAKLKRSNKGDRFATTAWLRYSRAPSDDDGRSSRGPTKATGSRRRHGYVTPGRRATTTGE